MHFHEKAAGFFNRSVLACAALGETVHGFYENGHPGRFYLE